MIQASSLGAAFAESCRQHADKAALMHKVEGRYQSITYRELGDRVIALAGELLLLGIKPGDRIALISENRPEWAVVDFACLSIGAVLVPIYTSLSAAQVQYILRDSGADFLFAENEDLAAKSGNLRSSGVLKAIWIFDIGQSSLKGVESFQDLAGRARKTVQREKDNVPGFQEKTNRHDLATLIYTSGTTGLPKGVMLSHGNLLANMESVLQTLDIGPEDTMLSLLPLAHIFERLCGHLLPLCQGATVAYAESPHRVGENLLEVQPTVMIAVPRFYEKMRARILEAAEKSSSVRRLIFNWAIRTGHKAAKRPPGSKFNLRYRLADRLVLSKLKERTGGRLRFFVSGGAALPSEIGEFFQAAGIMIIEGYGLTETSSVLSVNRLDRSRFSTVGLPLPGVEIKIAPDGEILAKGPNVMQGYHNLPGETKSAFDDDGFFKTGDIGCFDDQGFLAVTGRKKEILITSNGKNIAPTPIENLLKSSPYIAEVMLIGDGRPYLSALVVPDFKTLQAGGIGQNGASRDPEALIRNQQTIRLIEYEIARLSAGLAEFERAREFTLLPREFSIAEGELTPTLKVRREIVQERFSEHIEKMYQS